MRAVGRACLSLLCLALASCGGSSKTSRLSLKEFEAKLQSMRTNVELECEDCSGTGQVPDPETGDKLPCPACKGAGKLTKLHGPARADFLAAFGEPETIDAPKTELYREFWYYAVAEGTVRLPVEKYEPRGDVERVKTGQPKLVD